MPSRKPMPPSAATVTSADGSTSGTVSSVAIGSGGAVTATLSNGATLALGSGVTVS